MLLFFILDYLLALPVMLLVAARLLFKRISRETAKNRFGLATLDRPDGQLIWVHAASVGELSSVRLFLAHLKDAHPDHHILVTTNNPNALQVAAGWPDLPLLLQAAPLDIPDIVSRFLNHWQPIAFVNVEAEFWPTRFHLLARRNIPAIVLNGRLSKGSARKLGLVGAKAAGLKTFRHIYCQDTASAERFAALGLPESQITATENLKALVQLPAPDPALKSVFVHGETLLAASTHQGEDTLILQAFKHLQKSHPETRLIIAPRHAHRAGEVLDLAKSAGFDAGPLTAPATVTIAGTLGDLPALYPLAAVTLVCGSFFPKIGGHTPYEPIAANSAIITGPHTHNFAREYQTLTDQNAALTAATPDDLATAMAQALSSANSLASNAATALPAPHNPTALFTKASQHLDLGRLQ